MGSISVGAQSCSLAHEVVAFNSFYDSPCIDRVSHCFFRNHALHVLNCAAHIATLQPAVLPILRAHRDDPATVVTCLQQLTAVLARSPLSAVANEVLVLLSELLETHRESATVCAAGLEFLSHAAFAFRHRVRVVGRCFAKQSAFGDRCLSLCKCK
jgi:hypothetical protein